MDWDGWMSQDGMSEIVRRRTGWSKLGETVYMQ